MSQDRVLEIAAVNSWKSAVDPETQKQAVAALEAGKVVTFPNLGFVVEGPEQRFLNAAESGIKSKNLSYDPKTGELAKTELDEAGAKLLIQLLERYGKGVVQMLGKLIPAYSGHLVQGRTTCRPVEIRDRMAKPKQDDKRIHVDSFSGLPLHGKRILRVFTNVAPDGAERHWQVGEPFPDLAKKFMPRLKPPFPGSIQILQLRGKTSGKRSLYDHYMLGIHDGMKLDEEYQSKALRADLHFKAGTSWMCFTDQVPHAALAGHGALEQTFSIPANAMVDPSTTPLKVLESMTGRVLV